MYCPFSFCCWGKMIERGKTENPPKHRISLYWPEVKRIKTFFFFLIHPCWDLGEPSCRMSSVLCKIISAVGTIKGGSQPELRIWALPIPLGELGFWHWGLFLSVRTGSQIPLNIIWAQSQGLLSPVRFLGWATSSPGTADPEKHNSQEAFKRMKPFPGPAQRPPGTLGCHWRWGWDCRFPQGAAPCFTSGA